MKKIKLILLLALVAVFAVACADRATLEEVDAGKTYTYIKDGSFFVNNKGAAVPVADTEGKKIVSLYTEPICPYCVALEDEISPYLYEIQGDNTLMNIVPLTFLGRKGVEGEVTYSDVMTATWLSIAENDPENIGAFYHLTSSTPFLTALQNSPNQNLFIQEAYTKTIGGTKWEDVAADLEEFMGMSQRMTAYARTDRDLAKKTKEGKVTTPTMIVQGDDMALELNEGNIRQVLEEALR